MIRALTLVLPALAPLDWPEFKGSARTCIAPAVGSDFQWGEDGPEVVWRAEVGPGYGGVAVRDGEVVLLDREVGERDILRVLSLETGEELWSADYEAPGRLNYSGSRTVPSVRERTIVTCGGFGHVTGFDREEREIAWQVDLQEVFGGRTPMFGWSSSPLVYDDTVVVPALGEEVGLVALDLATGEERWVTAGVGYSHSTPTLLELAGRRQVVFLSTSDSASGTDRSAPMRIHAFNPVSGEPLWQTEIELTRLPIPGPVRIDDEHFLVTGGYRGGTTMMRITKQDGEFVLEEGFHLERGAQVHAPILHDEHVYLLVNENWNYTSRRQAEGGLMCIDLEGNEKWRTGDEPFFGRGSPILAGDHLLVQDGFTGTLRVARATPEGYQQVAEASVFDHDGRSDDRMWAPMALSGGLLLMRSQEELVCVRL